MNAEVPLIVWDAPGPYEVAFSTRVGGVSEGPFESLNLARMSADRAEHVIENRQRLCAAVGADPARLTLNRHTHSATVNRAHAMLKLTADCVPIAIARADGDAPALALLHAGWRGLSEGVVRAGVDAIGAGRLAAIVGPSIGPCCYEVGPEVARQFDVDLLRATHLDLWATSERALRAAGVETVERLDLCTRCNPDLFFSHRRSGKRRGAQGVIGYVAG